MANGNTNGNGWRSLVITSLIAIMTFLVGFGVVQIQDKADKKEVDAVELRSENRDKQLREDLNRSIAEFNKTTKDIYQLLIERGR